MHKKLLIISILFFPVVLFPAILVRGDKNAPEETTFSFGIHNTLITPFNSLYVAANEAITTDDAKIYAIARLNRGATAFEPLAPEKVTLNGTPGANNPLFGAKNNALGLLRPPGSSTDLLVAVADTNPAVVYLVQNTFSSNNMILVSTTPLRDAAGNVSSGVVDLTTNMLAYVFAAVKPANGLFGDLHSGIALMARGTIDNDTKFGEIDAQTGKVTPFPRAFPLDKTSALVTLNSQQLAVMQNSVTMHWSDALQRLFIGLQTTSNSGSNDGTRAVVVGKLTENGGMELFPIAPDNAFENGNRTSIVGARGADQTVSIYDITTLYTSTGLSYLIVVGGNGTSQQTVFALPLVSSGDETGTLANKNNIPHNVYQDTEVQKLIARSFTQPATTPEEMTQATDNVAQVGGGPLAGSITNLIVRDDTIYALVGNEITTKGASGIYSSQALFDASGKIKGWTEWQHAAGTTDPVFEGALNTADGTFIYATGTNENSVNTVFQTTWSNGSPQGLLPITTYFESIFSVSNGGIQSLQTFLPSTPGLSDISLLIAGGIGTITLVQTGEVENNILIPTPGDEFDRVTVYDDGTIDDFTDTKIVTITGGALDAVGPITAIEIGKNSTNGWLFVGGSDGLAVLAQADGSGWNVEQEELGIMFDGFIPGMSFKRIDNYRFVKKLIYEDNFLFIVTNNTVDRLNLSTSNFGTNQLDITTIATTDTLPSVSSKGTILDAVISQALALIATTGGLVRIADDKDVRLLTSAQNDDWTPIVIPETGGAPTQLLAVSQTGRAQDITRTVGGQVYVLTSNAGFAQSRINRFSVSPLQPTQLMQSTTIQAFDDQFVKNIPSFFLNFGNFNSIFATDGGLYFASHNKHMFIPPRVVLTPAEPAPRVGTRNVGERSFPVAINVKNGTEINALQRSQASGSWIAAGDFGMQVLE